MRVDRCESVECVVCEEVKTIIFYSVRVSGV